MNSFQLKLIALFLMTLDHFYSAASTFTHAPIILTQCRLLLCNEEEI